MASVRSSIVPPEHAGHIIPRTEEGQDWKTYVPALVHAYNCIRNAATDYSLHYLLLGRGPRLPIDVEFGLKREIKWFLVVSPHM